MRKKKTIARSKRKLGGEGKGRYVDVLTWQGTDFSMACSEVHLDVDRPIVFRKSNNLSSFVLLKCPLLLFVCSCVCQDHFSTFISCSIYLVPFTNFISGLKKI